MDCVMGTGECGASPGSGRNVTGVVASAVMRSACSMGFLVGKVVVPGGTCRLYRTTPARCKFVSSGGALLAPQRANGLNALAERFPKASQRTAPAVERSRDAVSRLV